MMEIAHILNELNTYRRKKLSQTKIYLSLIGKQITFEHVCYFFETSFSSVFSIHQKPCPGALCSEGW